MKIRSMMFAAIGIATIAARAEEPTIFNQPEKTILQLQLQIKELEMEVGDLKQQSSAWKTRYARDVFVDEQPGDTFAEKLQSAFRQCNRWGVRIHLPPGYHDLHSTVVLAKDAENATASPSHLASSMEILGHGCHIRWVGAENQSMIDMPSPNSIRVTGALTLDANHVPGVIGIHHRPAWRWNRNSSKGNIFEQIVIKNAATGVWIGDPLGPDFVCNTWRNCQFLECDTCVVLQGANVTHQALDDCTYAYRVCGIRAIGSAPKIFSAGEVQDPWGAAWQVDSFETEQWRLRINHTGEPKTFGGAAMGVVRGGCASGRNQTAVFCMADYAPMEIEGIRKEGLGSLFSSIGPRASKNRFRSYVVRCNTTHVDTPAILHKGGYDLVVDGGQYGDDIIGYRADAITLRDVAFTHGGKAIIQE